MKFAQLALLGVVTAKHSVFDNLDFEIEEALRVTYSNEAIKEYENQVMDMAKLLKKNEKKIHNNMEKTFGPIVEKWMQVGPKYLPELEAWGTSPSVMAKHHYEDNVIAKSDLMEKLEDAAEEVYEDFTDGKYNMGAKWNKKGYTEHIANEDLQDLLEDLYEVKQAFKALVESKMVEKNNKLGLKTLEDQHFQKIWAWFQEDMEFEGLEGLAKKACETIKMMKKKESHCKVAKALKMKVIKLLKTIKKTREISQTGSVKKWQSWAEEQNFQPWN